MCRGGCRVCCVVGLDCALRVCCLRCVCCVRCVCCAPGVPLLRFINSQTYPPVMGLCAGARGEMSKGIKILLDAASECAAEKSWRETGATSWRHARDLYRTRLRRGWGIFAQAAAARLSHATGHCPADFADGLGGCTPPPPRPPAERHHERPLPARRQRDAARSRCTQGMLLARGEGLAAHVSGLESLTPLWTRMSPESQR